MKIKLILITTIALISTEAYAQNQTQPLKLSLEECLGRALEYNYTKQSVELNEQTKRSSLSQSRMERLPNLSANLSEGVSNTKSAGTSWSGNYDLSASVTLFQGGQVNNTIKQNELQYEQTKLQTHQYDNELITQVLQSFLNALGNEELLKHQEAMLVASRKQAEEGKIRFAAGQILESDYLLLEAQYANDLNSIYKSRISRDNSLIALKNLIVIDLLQPVELIYPDDSYLEHMLVMPSVEAVLERGMETMPEVKISDYSVQIAEMGVKIAKSALVPTISLNAGIGTGHTQNYNNFGTQLSDRFGPQAGISISIPIFNKGKTRNSVIQSRVALQQVELEKKQSLTDIEEMLINEYNNVIASAQSYKASQIRQSAYNSSFLAYSEMFKVGSITTVELLQQQNNYISAMNDYVQNKYTFMLQRKVLDVYMGKEIKM